MSRKTILARVFFGVFPLLLMSCSTAHIEMISSRNLNPDFNTFIPSPIVVKIYQLKSLSKFSTLDFYSISDSPEKFLGADFLSVQSTMIAPNRRLDLDMTLKSETKYIGVVAEFQNIDESKWRAVIPVESSRKYEILLDQSAVFILDKGHLSEREQILRRRFIVE